MYGLKKPPCYACTERYMLCRCDKYQQWRNELDRLNEQRYIELKRQDDYYVSKRNRGIK